MGQAICWMDDELLPLHAARVPVLDHGLLYGDGVFEGIRFYGGEPLLLAEHLRRLRDSARAIALDLLWNSDELEQIVRDTVAASGLDDGYLRLLVTRGDGALGIDPRSCVRPRLIVIADRLQLLDPAVRHQGARLIIAATRRLPPDGLDPRIKSLNYLNHILARIEANRAGADEAVLINAQGRVTEGSADNLFIVRDGQAWTPPVSDGALAGITRGLLFELADEADIDMAERSLTAFDLYSADECFLSGTAAELIPVRSIDERAMGDCPGPVFQRLDAAFRARVEQLRAQSRSKSAH